MNALVICPGTKPDRRHTQRGDRREGPPRPCGHSFGRVVSGQVYVRLQPRAIGAAQIVVSCPACSARVEFLTVAAEAA